MSTVPKDIIIPPEKVKVTIEKTAGYIARNGMQFKNRLLKDSGDKFTFLNEKDPFNKYFEHVLQNYDNSVAARGSGAVATGLRSEQDLAKPELPAVADWEFLMDLSGISKFDLEKMKLVARYEAVCSGDEVKLAHLKQFLVRRSATGGSEFDFMNESHRMHAVYAKLVKQYTSVLLREKYAKYNEIAQFAHSKDGSGPEYRLKLEILKKCYLRAENEYWASQKDIQRQKELEKEKLEYASINWDDFKVVETIEFTDMDKYSELAEPLIKNDLIFRSMQQKKATALIEEAPPDFEASDAQESEPNSKLVKRQPLKGMKIVDARDPRFQRRLRPGASVSGGSGGADSSGPMVQSPITGEMIPESEFEAHLKVVLRDSRYEEEKSNYLKKTMGSNLTDAEVIENIKRLRGLGEEKRDVKRAKVQWDGYRHTAKRAKEMARQR